MSSAEQPVDVAEEFPHPTTTTTTTTTTNDSILSQPTPPSWTLDMFDATPEHARDATYFVGGRRAQRLWAGAFLLREYISARDQRHFSALATTAQRRGLLKSSVVALGFHQDEVVARLQRRLGAVVDVALDRQVDLVQVVRVRRGEVWGVAADFEVGSLIAIVFLNAIDATASAPLRLSNASTIGSLVRPRERSMLIWRQTGEVALEMPAASSPTSRWMLVVAIRGSVATRDVEAPALPVTASLLLDSAPVVVHSTASDSSAEPETIEEHVTAEQLGASSLHRGFLEPNGSRNIHSDTTQKPTEELKPTEEQKMLDERLVIIATIRELARATEARRLPIRAAAAAAAAAAANRSAADADRSAADESETRAADAADDDRSADDNADRSADDAASARETNDDRSATGIWTRATFFTLVRVLTIAIVLSACLIYIDSDSLAHLMSDDL